MSVTAPNHPADLVSAGHLRAARDRVTAFDARELSRDHQIELDRLRGLLALHGHGSLPDLVHGAHLELQAEDGNPAIAAQAIRRLSLVGATALADELLSSSAQRWPASDEIRFVGHQRKAGRTRVFDEIEQRAVESVVSVQAEYGRRLLSEAAEDPSLDAATRIRLHDLLARSYRAGRLHGEAADSLIQLEAHLPGADALPTIQLAIALDLWASGQPDRAMGYLSRAGQSSAQALSYEDRRVREITSQLIDVLELDPEATAAGPRWATNAASYRPAPTEPDPGRAILRSMASRLGFTVALPSEAPTTAHVRRAARDAGASIMRVRVDPSGLDQVLDKDVVLVLDEDRLDGTGFVSVIDVDPVARLLLIADPSLLGPELATFDEWTLRSGIHQWSGFVVAAPGPAGSDALENLSRRGLSHDPVLDRLDGCNVSQDGTTPPADEILTVVSRIAADDPSRALAHQLLGESIVRRLPHSNRASELFDRWILETRSHFPTADWPLRTHGSGLLALGRPDEALALMSQAVAKNPRDVRNHLGLALAAVEAGQDHLAGDAIEAALARQDGCAAAYTVAAELAIDDDGERAKQLAKIAAALQPEDGRTLALVATLLEQGGRSDDAASALRDAASAQPPAVLARHRLVRHHERNGRWDEATTAATGLLRTEPSESRSWATAAWSAHRRADLDEALDRWLSGIQCCGAARELVEGAATTIAALAPPALDREPLQRLLRHLGPDFDGHHVVSAVLADFGQITEAVEIAERATDLRPGSINGPFRLAQRLASDPRTRAAERSRLVQLLEDVVAQAGDFAPPRILLADLLIESDPERAIATVRGANDEEAPALVLGMSARLLDRFADPGSSAGIRTALGSLRPGVVLEYVPWLSSVRLDQLLLDILATAYGANRSSLELAAQLGFALDAAGRPREALELARWVQSSVPGLLDIEGFLGIAERSGAWNDVAEAGDQSIATLTGDSRFEGDVWPLRARVAGARNALGDVGPRAEFLAAAPRHHEAIFELARVDWLASSTDLAEDEALLRSLAPGQADRLALLREGIVR